MPSTVSATITIVANTGWLMATRVIHMPLARVWRRALDGARAALALQAYGLAVLQVVEPGRNDVLVRLQAGEDLDEMGALIARAERDRPPLEAVSRGRADRAPPAPPPPP